MPSFAPSLPWPPDTSEGLSQSSLQAQLLGLLNIAIEPLSSACNHGASVVRCFTPITGFSPCLVGQDWLAAQGFHECKPNDPSSLVSMISNKTEIASSQDSTMSHIIIILTNGNDTLQGVLHWLAGQVIRQLQHASIPRIYLTLIGSCHALAFATRPRQPTVTGDSSMTAYEMIRSLPAGFLSDSFNNSYSWTFEQLASTASPEVCLAEAWHSDRAGYPELGLMPSFALTFCGTMKPAAEGTAEDMHVDTAEDNMPVVDLTQVSDEQHELDAAAPGPSRPSSGKRPRPGNSSDEESPASGDASLANKDANESTTFLKKEEPKHDKTKDKQKIVRPASQVKNAALKVIAAAQGNPMTRLHLSIT